MTNNTVSVIIPSFGGGQNLKRSIDSVLCQSYKAIECIVVDDNGIGTKNQLATQLVMNEYEGDNRVRYICHEHNINASAARNTGVRNSTGSFIALLDDDDCYYTDNILTQVKLLSKLSNDYALTYCGYDIYNNDLLLNTHKVSFSGQDIYQTMLHNVDIPSSSFLIRKSVYEELGGFDEKFRRHQDWEFIVRVQMKYKVHTVNYIGYRRYLEERNSPRSRELAFKYRKFYIETLLPQITTLSDAQKKDIAIENLLNVSHQFFVRDHNLWAFIKDYVRISPGYRGVRFLFRPIKRRLINFLGR